MRRMLAVLLLFSLFCGFAAAQETGYERALALIREAEATGAMSLNLSNFDLSELPPEIGNLRNLQDLLLYGNSLSSLPFEIGNLRGLRELNLDVNEFQSLPPEIGQLSNLVTLSLSHNAIRELSPEIGGLVNLDALWLEYNLLQTLPVEIGNLKHLNVLMLSNNQLSSLPQEITKLENLCVLSIVDNQFRYLPTFVAELRMMNEGLMCGISLEGNPLISPPEDIVEQGTSAVFDYLRSEWWWNLAKLIVSLVAMLGLAVGIVWALRWRNNRAIPRPKARRTK